MSVSIEQVGRGGVMTIDITGATGTGAGAVGEVSNPEGVDLLILRTTFHILTASTGAANLSCGVAASGGTFNDIISALAVNGSVAGKFYNGHAMQNGAKTEITAPVKWGATDKLGFTGSASTAGFTGRLYVEYVRVG